VEQYLLDEKEIFESGKPMLNREEQVVDPDGNVHWALTSKVPIRNKSGTVVGLVGVNRDITELKRLRDKEQALMESLRRELALAENIQRGFLPRKLPQPEGWDLAAHYMPAYEVGGDFYDVFSLDSHTIAFWIGDVSGKSISAAILMSHTTTLLRAFAEHFHAESHNPLDVVENLNRHICSYHSHRGAERRFVTLFFGILHTKTGIINYVNAGHLPPYIASADRQLLRVAPTGPALGLTPDATYESATHQLQPGEVLFAYTDWVTEAQNTHGAFFSKNRLERILSEDLAHPRHYLDGVLDAVHEHTGGKVRSDDIAILALRRKVSAD
jgi:sigma-B regulation protein RsbU (phosphoserine phosphatase)